MNRIQPFIDFARGLSLSRMAAWFVFINGTLGLSCLWFGPDVVAAGIAAVWDSVPSVLVSSGELTP